MKKLAAVFLVFLLLAAHAHAATIELRQGDEEWNRRVEANLELLRDEARSEALRMKYRRMLGLVLSGGETAGRTNVAEVKVQGGWAMGCGGGNLIAELESVLDVRKALQAVESTLTTLVAEAPLLVACYYSPTLCSYIKYLRQMMNAAVQIRGQQCAVLNRWIAQRVRDAEAERLDECVRAKGGGYAALDECKEELRENPLWGLPLEGGEYRVIESSLRKIYLAQGLSEGEAREKAELWSGIFGDIILRAGEGGGKSGNAPDVRGTVHDLEWADYKDRIRHIDRILGILAAGALPSPEDLKPWVTPSFYLTPRELEAIYRNLGPVRTRLLLRRLAELAAREKIAGMLAAAEQTYLRALAKAKTQSEREGVQRVVRQIRSLRKEYGGDPRKYREEAREIVASSLSFSGARSYGWTERGKPKPEVRSKVPWM